MFSRYFCRPLILILLLALLGASGLLAQTKQLITWQEQLTYLQTLSAEDLIGQRDGVAQIRAGIELWLKLHPNSTSKLAEAPPQPWTGEQIAGQVTSLREIVAAIMKEDSGRPFDLGVTTVSVTGEASPLSPVSDTIVREEIVNRQAITVASALDFLAGVTIDHVTSNRNEAGIRIRGFSSRGQIPLYLDGIPVSMPYDATIDFNRFLTNDIAEIQVAKGYSSPLLGPNALGGSINLVTKQPEKKLDADALIGTGSGDLLLASAHLGSRWRHFYAQGSVDWLQSNFMPLSGNFPLNKFQPTFERNNSDYRDQKYNGRFAWTPKGQDEYVFSYVNQKGQKGVPLYAGPNSAATFGSAAFRRWPYWNKTGYYFISNTGLGIASTLRFRAYYDQFNNEFDFYDDATFSTMKKTTSSHSYYDDHAAGLSTEFTNRSFRRNVISASFFFRDDTHTETNEVPAKAPYPFISPTLSDRSQSYSIGAQDIITISERIRGTLGFSADHLNGLRVQMFNSAQTALLPVTCVSAPQNNTFSGCTAHDWNVNPQASLSWTLAKSDTLYVTFADRGRFPILKESYSYRLGQAIPNPDLKPEKSTNWTVGYSHVFGSRTVGQVDYFHHGIRNAIESVYVKDPGGFCTNTGSLAGYCSQNVNVANEAHQGVEISIRSTPISRLTLDVNYSYLNRTIVYDFSSVTDISRVLTTIQILPTLAKNKLLATATLRLPRQILAMANVRYEGGITLQDTTYKTAPGNLPYGAAYGTMDLGTVIPVHYGVRLQAGVKNLFNRDYYYTAGFPETGRSWYFNARYKF